MSRVVSRAAWSPLAVLLLAAAVLGGWDGSAGASSRAAASTLPRLSVVPVDACTSETARGGSGPAWVPTELPAVLSPAAARSLAFYSVGTESVLGPRGWDCAQLSAADGSAQMAVYPPGGSDPVKTAMPPSPGARLVDATFDYTGHGPGFDLACPYFPSIKLGTATCPSTVPAGETVKRLTPDVVRITDPAGVKGGLDGSGGSRSVTGLMIVPQSTTLHSEPIAEISCSLTPVALCAGVVRDFVVRQFPVPTSATG